MEAEAVVAELMGWAKNEMEIHYLDRSVNQDELLARLAVSTANLRDIRRSLSLSEADQAKFDEALSSIGATMLDMSKTAYTSGYTTVLKTVANKIMELRQT
jgi:hypothetical protein